MRRLPSLLVFTAIFMGGSIVWPYEAEGADAPDEPGFRWYRTPVPTLPRDIGFLDVEDEWGGESVIGLYDKPFQLTPTLLTERAEQRLILNPGARILPGTRWINASYVANSFDGAPPNLFLEATAANDFRFHSVKLSAEKATSLRIDLLMADWSPDPDTRWTFTLSSASAVPVEGRLRLEMARGEEMLPSIVEYKDRWNGMERLRVFDQRARLQDAAVASPLATSTYQPAAAPLIKALPSVGIQKLIVVLEYNSTTPTELHYDPLLSYRGADREFGQWERQALAPTTARRQNQDGTFVWQLPVEPRMWDSPFAELTRWAVNVNWYGDVGSSPTLMDGNFHFYIDVVRVPKA